MTDEIFGHETAQILDNFFPIIRKFELPNWPNEPKMM